jgi:protein-tyrosine phosphatase
MPMINLGRLATFGLIASLALPGPAVARPADARAERTAAGAVTIFWKSAGGIDLYVSDRAGAGISEARLVSRDDRDGSEVVAVSPLQRRYFILRDRLDNSIVETAERALPLQHGSNFRDVGGYPGADGKHVRWGMIFRSGATPLLTEDDLSEIHGLGLRTLVDLRSSEERALAPSRIDGVEYRAIGYSMLTMIKPGEPMRNGSDLYRNFPAFLAPHLRVLFATLLQGGGPVAYNCSAGQDRTGFATAMVLSALGVPRDTVIQDYLLSTQLRHPQYEMPPIDPALHKDNPVAQMFAGHGQPGTARQPQPLVEADGRPFLVGALDEIEHKWGSVDAYLEQEIGLGKADVAKLRSLYLN